MAHPNESDQPNLDQAVHSAQPPAAFRSDGVVNPRTGTGTARSKQNGVWFQPRLLNVNDAKTVYQASDMAKTIVDLPAEEMTRAGVCVTVKDEPEAGEEIDAALSDLKAEARFKDAISKMRCMGGSVIMINVTDGVTDPAQPLNENGLRSVDSLTVLEPGEVQVTDWHANPAGKDYGQPAFYQITPRVIGTGADAGGSYFRKVHASRMIHFSGPMISRDMLTQNYGFGMSILDHVWEVISRFDQNYDAAGTLIDDFAQAVFKVKGLYRSMTANGGVDIRKRLELMDSYRSMLRGIALDADGEEFERKATPLTGLPDVIDRFALRLAAASRMPLTVLMGKAPAGLAATGDNDTLMWYDQIKKLQVLDLKPAYERLVQLVQMASEGPTKGKVAEDWTIHFNALWQESDETKAKVRLTMAQADTAYAALGAIDSQEIRNSRWKKGSFSVETEIEDTGSEDADADALNEEEGTTTNDPVTGEPIQVMPGQTAPVAKPGAPGAIGPAGGPKVQDQAMNGAQVTSLVDVVSRYHAEEIPRESAIAILEVAFKLSPEDAAKVVGPEDFEPKEELPPVIAAPGQPKPGAPAAQPKPTPKPE